jgi:hypothetical protein
MAAICSASEREAPPRFDAADDTRDLEHAHALSPDLIGRVLGQGNAGCLRPPHEDILVIRVVNDHVEINEALGARDHKVPRDHETEVEVQRADERLENVFADAVVFVPSISNALVVHEDKVIQAERPRYLTETFAAHDLRSNSRQKSLLLRRVPIEEVFPDDEINDGVSYEFESFIGVSEVRKFLERRFVNKCCHVM